MNWNKVINEIYINIYVYQYLLKSFMCDIIFRFDKIWGVLKYVIKSKKACRHINFFVSICSKQVFE